jgi:hypothetical protein
MVRRRRRGKSRGCPNGGRRAVPMGRPTGAGRGRGGDAETLHPERERHLRRHAVLVRIYLLLRHSTNREEESHAKNRKAIFTSFPRCGGSAAQRLLYAALLQGDGVCAS